MSSPGELISVRDLLRFAVSEFSQAGIYFGHGSGNAYDEAVNLIFQVLRLPLDTVEIFLDARLTDKEKNELLNLINRRIAERIPAAYLTRQAWLAGYEFYVDERVIIPRSFIAELLSEALYPWVANPDSVSHALDLCTGSGCLAILMALAFPSAHIDAVDISPEALEVARINIEKYGLGDRVNLIQSDMWENVPLREYDVIIANPPYVAQDSMNSLPAEYRHEPALALAGGDDGLSFIRLILSRAEDFLNEDGVLVVEFGHNRATLEKAYPHIEFVWPETAGGDDFLFLLTKKFNERLG